MKVSQTNPVRRFSAISMVIPVSIPITSESYQFLSGLKRIDESVLAPGRGISASNVFKTRRVAAGRNGNEPPAALGTTVPSIGPHRRRSAPYDVTLLRIGGCNAPEIVAVVRKLLA